MTEKKILIVDYDTKNTDHLARLFSCYDFNIVKANDGATAYEKYKTEQPDLIILEAMLPKMHGFDLTKKISQETDGRLPIIIVTGIYRGAQYRNEALNFLGASDYFEKPVDEKSLVKKVLSLLGVEAEVEEELPNPDSVLENLARRIKKGEKRAKEEEKKKKEEASPRVETTDVDLKWVEELSELGEIDVEKELSSFLKKEKKKS
ncbi:MAG: PleD family two-component system response regulator [Candidatus Aminicenantales bacterium]